MLFDYEQVKTEVKKFFGEQAVDDFSGSNKEGLICKVHFKASNNRSAWGFLTVSVVKEKYSIVTRRDSKEGESLADLFSRVVFSNNTKEGITGAEVKEQ